MLGERDIVARVDGLTIRQLRLWVRHGWIRPATSERGPVFSDLDLARIRLVCQLRQEMLVNHEAVPIVLSLIDQVYGLRRELRTLARALATQPNDVATKVLDTVQRERARRSG